MRAQAAVAVALLAGGVAVLAIAASRGEASGGLFLVLPFVVATGPLGFAGVVLLGLGLALALGALATRRAATLQPPPPPSGAAGASAPRAGGFILVGPIPIAFGTTRGMALAMLALALATVALLLLVPRLLGGA